MSPVSVSIVILFNVIPTYMVVSPPIYPPPSKAHFAYSNVCIESEQPIAIQKFPSRFPRHNSICIRFHLGMDFRIVFPSSVVSYNVPGFVSFLIMLLLCLFV
jgi:hypothetical protein